MEPNNNIPSHLRGYLSSSRNGATTPCFSCGIGDAIRREPAILCAVGQEPSRLHSSNKTWGPADDSNVSVVEETCLSYSMNSGGVFNPHGFGDFGDDNYDGTRIGCKYGLNDDDEVINISSPTSHSKRRCEALKSAPSSESAGHLSSAISGYIEKRNPFQTSLQPPESSCMLLEEIAQRCEYTIPQKPDNNMCTSACLGESYIDSAKSHRDIDSHDDYITNSPDLISDMKTRDKLDRMKSGFQLFRNVSRTVPQKAIADFGIGEGLSVEEPDYEGAYIKKRKSRRDTIARPKPTMSGDERLSGSDSGFHKSQNAKKDIELEKPLDKSDPARLNTNSNTDETSADMSNNYVTSTKGDNNSKRISKRKKKKIEKREDVCVSGRRALSAYHSDIKNLKIELEPNDGDVHSDRAVLSSWFGQLQLQQSKNPWFRESADGYDTNAKSGHLTRLMAFPDSFMDDELDGFTLDASGRVVEKLDVEGRGSPRFYHPYNPREMHRTNITNREGDNGGVDGDTYDAHREDSQSDDVLERISLNGCDTMPAPNKEKDTHRDKFFSRVYANEPKDNAGVKVAYQRDVKTREIASCKPAPGGYFTYVGSVSERNDVGNNTPSPLEREDDRHQGNEDTDTMIGTVANCCNDTDRIEQMFPQNKGFLPPEIAVPTSSKKRIKNEEQRPEEQSLTCDQKKKDGRLKRGNSVESESTNGQIKQQDVHERQIKRDMMREASKFQTEEMKRLVKANTELIEKRRKKKERKRNSDGSVRKPMINAQRYREQPEHAAVNEDLPYFNPEPKPAYGSNVGDYTKTEKTHPHYFDPRDVLVRQDDTAFVGTIGTGDELTESYDYDHYKNAQLMLDQDDRIDYAVRVVHRSRNNEPSGIPLEMPYKPDSTQSDPKISQHENSKVEKPHRKKKKSKRAKARDSSVSSHSREYSPLDKSNRKAQPSKKDTSASPSETSVSSSTEKKKKRKVKRIVIVKPRKKEKQSSARASPANSDTSIRSQSKKSKPKIKQQQNGAVGGPVVVNCLNDSLDSPNRRYQATLQTEETNILAPQCSGDLVAIQKPSFDLDDRPAIVTEISQTETGSNIIRRTPRKVNNVKTETKRLNSNCVSKDESRCKVPQVYRNVPTCCGAFRERIEEKAKVQTGNNTKNEPITESGVKNMGVQLLSGEGRQLQHSVLPNEQARLPRTRDMDNLYPVSKSRSNIINLLVSKFGNSSHHGGDGSNTAMKERSPYPVQPNPKGIKPNDAGSRDKVKKEAQDDSPSSATPVDETQEACSENNETGLFHYMRQRNHRRSSSSRSRKSSRFNSTSGTNDDNDTQSPTPHDDDATKLIRQPRKQQPILAPSDQSPRMKSGEMSFSVQPYIQSRGVSNSIEFQSIEEDDDMVGDGGVSLVPNGKRMKYQPSLVSGTETVSSMRAISPARREMSIDEEVATYVKRDRSTTRQPLGTEEHEHNDENAGQEDWDEAEIWTPEEIRAAGMYEDFLNIERPFIVEHCARRKRTTKKGSILDRGKNDKSSKGNTEAPPTGVVLVDVERTRLSEEEDTKASLSKSNQRPVTTTGLCIDGYATPHCCSNDQTKSEDRVSSMTRILRGMGHTVHGGAIGDETCHTVSKESSVQDEKSITESHTKANKITDGDKEVMERRKRTHVQNTDNSELEECCDMSSDNNDDDADCSEEEEESDEDVGGDDTANDDEDVSDDNENGDDESDDAESCIETSDEENDKQTESSEDSKDEENSCETEVNETGNCNSAIVHECSSHSIRNSVVQECSNSGGFSDEDVEEKVGPAVEDVSDDSDDDDDDNECNEDNGSECEEDREEEEAESEQGDDSDNDDSSADDDENERDDGDSEDDD